MFKINKTHHVGVFPKEEEAPYGIIMFFFLDITCSQKLLVVKNRSFSNNFFLFKTHLGWDGVVPIHFLDIHVHNHIKMCMPHVAASCRFSFELHPWVPHAAPLYKAIGKESNPEGYFYFRFLYRPVQLLMSWGSDKGFTVILYWILILSGKWDI